MNYVWRKVCVKATYQASVHRVVLFNEINMKEPGAVRLASYKSTVWLQRRLHGQHKLPSQGP